MNFSPHAKPGVATIEQLKTDADRKALFRLKTDAAKRRGETAPQLLKMYMDLFRAKRLPKIAAYYLAWSGVISICFNELNYSPEGLREPETIHVLMIEREIPGAIIELHQRLAKQPDVDAEVLEIGEIWCSSSNFLN